MLLVAVVLVVASVGWPSRSFDLEDRRGATQEAGIDAKGHDTFNVGTQVLSDYSVTVRRRDLAAAAQVYDG